MQGLTRGVAQVRARGRLAQLLDASAQHSPALRCMAAGARRRARVHLWALLRCVDL